MSLDRQAIEKRDFPISRRGYETLAVDAHLAQLAREVETLQAERRTTADPAPVAVTPSLASSASEQVRSIVQAAERSAAEIEQQATDDAARRRTDASTEADATRAAAEAEAQAHVSTVQGEARSMLERIQAVESLLEHLRTTALEIQGGLDALHAQVGTLGVEAPVGAAPAAAAAPTPVPPAAPAAAPTPVPAAAPAAAVAAVPPAVPVEQALPATPPVAQSAVASVELAAPAAPVAAAAPASSGPLSEDEAGARMVALSLVLDGVPRDQVARHLDEHYALDDRDGLLDDLYARQP